MGIMERLFPAWTGLRAPLQASGSPTENHGALAVSPRFSSLAPAQPPRPPCSSCRGLWAHSLSAGPGKAGRYTRSWQTGNTWWAHSPRR